VADGPYRAETEFTTPADVALPGDTSDESPNDQLSIPRHYVKPIPTSKRHRHVKPQEFGADSEQSQDDSEAVDVVQPHFDDLEYLPEPLDDTREGEGGHRTNRGRSENPLTGWGAYNLKTPKDNFGD
jgi:hypothetical protein